MLKFIPSRNHKFGGKAELVFFMFADPKTQALQPIKNKPATSVFRYPNVC
jgi:hypothetical protein